MSRPSPVPDGPAADARTALPESETAAFDRLAHAVLASRSAPLGPLLRAQLPGTAGVQWLRHEGLPPTTRPSGAPSSPKMVVSNRKPRGSPAVLYTYMVI